EGLITSTREDIENIFKITGKTPSKIYVYSAGGWKRALYKLAYELKRFDEVMKLAMQNEEIKRRAQHVPKVLQTLIKNVNSLSPLILSEKEEMTALEDAASFFNKEFGADVSVAREGDAPPEHQRKAMGAMPMKPAVYLE
ncbi:MAG: hypothetical protein AB1468_06805, partial [Candidatus Micrarchaeota archaeon]